MLITVSSVSEEGFPWDKLPRPEVVASACPLCGSADTRLVYERGKGWQDHVGTYHCGRCTGLFTSPHHDANVLGRFYEEHFPRHLPFKTLTDEGRVVSGDAIVRSRFITDAVGALRGWRVLEIGSGSGDFLIEMCAAGAREGVGLEPALAVPEARHRAVTIRRQLARAPEDFGEGKYDLVAMFHVFEHLVDPIRVLGRLRERLVDGGFVAIEVPNLYRYRFPNPDAYFRHIHLFNFTPNSLRCVAAQCGLYPLRWNRVAGKHLSVVFGTKPGKPLRRDREGPDFDRCRAYLRFIAWFSGVEPALVSGRPRTAAWIRLAARAYARVLLRSVVP